jgi:Helix-turn-helix domain
VARRQQLADRALRPAMRSPGRPVPARHVERAFWRLIARGRRSEEAAVEVGVSAPVGTRWFRHAGGMPPLSLAEPTGRYLSYREREELALLTVQGLGVRAMARALNRHPGTISRELRRNSATRGGQREYRASVAQWKAQTAARRPKPAKLVTNPRLKEYVQRRLSGQLERPDGTVAPGPQTAWKGRNKPHRGGPVLGERVEPGADRAPAARRVPRR